MAAAPSVDEIDESVLLCGICSERFKHAKVLPCLHRFCKRCLQTLIEKNHANEGQLICPICRRKHVIPTEGVEAMSDDLYINSMVAKKFHVEANEASEEDVCEGCKKGSVVNRCIDCGVNFCDNCTVAHKNIPVTSKHKVMTIEAYRESKVSNPTTVQLPVYCTTHSDKLVELYCDTCNEAICFECTAFKHTKPDHAYKKIAASADEYKIELSELVNKMKTKEDEAVNSRQTIRKVSESLEACFQEERGKLEKHAKKTTLEVTRSIQENEKALMKELQSEFNKRRENLRCQVKDLDGTTNDLKDVIELGESMMAQASPAQLMCAKQRMVAHIDLLMKLETTLTPSEHHYLEFDSCGDFCAKRELGELRMTPKCEIQIAANHSTVGEEICITLIPSSTDRQVDLESYLEGLMIKPDGETEAMNKSKNEDGTLSLKNRAKMEGKHRIIVTVNKKELEGSPLTVWVIPKKGKMQRLAMKGGMLGQVKSPHGILRIGEGSALVCDMGNNRFQSICEGRKHQQREICVRVPSQPTHPRATTLETDDQQSREQGSVGSQPAHSISEVLSADNQESRNGQQVLPTYQPTYPCFAAMLYNDIYFTDSSLPESKQVVVCDKTGKLIRYFGSDVMKYPVGIALSPTKHRVYVVDNNSHCVHIYSLLGEWITTFGSHGDGTDQLCYPNCIAINSEGNLYISDKDNHRIQVYAEDGKHLFGFGCRGTEDGQLHCPFGVTTDAEDNVYVCDAGNRRVVKFTSRGEYICRVDSDEDGLKYPTGVCVTDDQPFGKVIVTDRDEHCVMIFTQ
ncbi:E3 ubiquitin-protein ligase TRIM45-like [Glandiceps talaboti]